MLCISAFVQWLHGDAAVADHFNLVAGGYVKIAEPSPRQDYAKACFSNANDLPVLFLWHFSHLCLYNTLKSGLSDYVAI